MTDKTPEYGEGNRQADRNYRKGVRETVAESSHEERAERARELSGDELKEARKAEEKTRKNG